MNQKGPPDLEGLSWSRSLDVVLLTPHPGERAQGRQLGRRQQLGSSWVNCTGRETRGRFYGTGHRGVWGEKEVERLAAVLRVSGTCVLKPQGPC